MYTFTCACTQACMCTRTHMYECECRRLEVDSGVDFHHAVQELMEICLPLSPECWNYRCEPPCSTGFVNLLDFEVIA